MRSGRHADLCPQISRGCSPTWSRTDRYGRYNAVNSGGYVSWYDFACAIFRTAGIPVTVLPVHDARNTAGALPRGRTAAGWTPAKLAGSGFAAAAGLAGRTRALPCRRTRRRIMAGKYKYP